jgi:hypothetical protein
MRYSVDQFLADPVLHRTIAGEAIQLPQKSLGPADFPIGTNKHDCRFSS